MNQVLVLNKSWLPITVVSIQKAIQLLYRGHARAVDTQEYYVSTWDEWVSKYAISTKDSVEEPENYIRTSSLHVRKPLVITLSTFNGFPKKSIAYSRRALYRRDNNTCQYCGTKLGLNNLTIDHVVPVSKGGKTSWDNCVIACRPCNSRKGNNLLYMTNMRLLAEPKPPTWKEYFVPEGQVLPEWKQFIKGE